MGMKSGPLKTVNFSAIVAADNHNLHAAQGVLTRNEVATVFGGMGFALHFEKTVTS
jgi:hypothetical protein